MMKYILLPVLLFLVQFNGISQNGSKEIIVHKDKPMYFIGDVAAYKVYLPSGLFEAGTIFSIRLSSPDEEIKSSHFVKATNEMSLSGYFKLPFSYSAGMYKMDIVAFDEAALKEVQIAHSWVPLYDDLEPLIDKIASTSMQSGNASMRDVKWGVNDGVGSMEIEIEETGIDGSISIQRKSDIPYNSFSSSSYETKSTYSKKLFFSGIAQGLDGTVLSNRPVASFIAQTNKHSLMKTNSNGGFVLMFDDFVDTKDIQIVDLGLEPVVVKVVPSSNSISVKRPTLVYTDTIIDLLRRKKEQRRVNKYFKTKSKAVVFGDVDIEVSEPKVISKKKKAYKPDDTYVFNDYKIFDNFAIFANEISQNLIFKEKGGKFECNYVFFITNGNYRDVGKELFLDPFFILDGKITRDANYIGGLDQTLLERVELEYDPRKMRERYSLFGKEGIVRLYSKTGNLPVPQEELGSIARIGGLQDWISTSMHNAPDSAMPVFDDFPYWKSNVDTSSESSLSVTPPSDPGDYELILVSRINGEIGVSKKTYTVK